MGGNSRGEDALHAFFVDAFTPTPGVSGPGDDCAQLEVGANDYLHWTCDQVVEGVHVEVGTAPEVQAKKLLRRTISDLAAAGAKPWLVSWTVAAPAERGQAWIRRLAEAFVAEAKAFGMAVVGGDLSNSYGQQHCVLTCQAMGRSTRPAAGRNRAQAGDVILVSGALGGAVESGRHLLPEPRIELGQQLCLHYQPSAMMDLSDGMAQDLPRILAASVVGAEVELTQLPLHKNIPANADGWRQAVADGEDYELLICLPPDQAPAALQDSRLPGLTAIGRLIEGSELHWLNNGEPLDFAAAGWEHGWSGESEN